jgi:hypothetical protein
MLIVRVNSELCHGTPQYGQCSADSACGCLHMTGGIDVGICGFMWVTCSELVSCASTNNVCYEPGHICIRHPRCHTIPVCYPVSMTNQQICPPISSKRTNGDLQIRVALMTLWKKSMKLGGDKMNLNYWRKGLMSDIC